MIKNQFHNLRGEKKDQLLITSDKNGNRIGLATREECHKGDGKTHLAFMALVVDKEKKIILTKRSKKKSLWGGFWDASVVSHVLSNETPQQAAKRRGKEELGIEADFQDLGAFYYFAKYGENCENEYCHVLVGESSKEVEFNPVEIEKIRKISLEELTKEIKNNPEIFTPWLKLALEKFEIY
ncbi:NUDIX domain-containing protein [Candidatus Gottesmanbacteria bacterium]|nr:NUDIX domain-containing protein [Candidatus Gottesmanbacteria bacterium]MBI5451981.1 NUDIX domain-containing protein [Candidatus Gottesmanbacteria bacterium]